MKKLKNILLLLLPFLTVLGGCGHDEIVFDYESPQFELRDDAILMEVVMPQGTAADDEIYISGDFNGGDEAALADMKWLMEKAADNDIKWGIYLYPEDFVLGKTLADGFHFVSKAQGVERTLKGEEAVHAANAVVGTRVNVTASRWNAYFAAPDVPVEVEHDGYAVFVVDNTGWSGLALYAWGDDIPELFGGWPGILPTGTEEVDGTLYKYFDTGEANKGLTYNLIFNDNGGGTQLDGPQGFTLDHDIYLELTSEGWKEIGDEPQVKHDGYAIFIEDRSGWNETAVYAWGDNLPELFGAWPGILPTGKVEVNGITYNYYDTGEANKGLTYNLIMNNNGGGSQFDLSTVTLDRDYYFSITDKSGMEISPDGESKEEKQ